MKFTFFHFFGVLMMVLSSCNSKQQYPAEPLKNGVSILKTDSGFQLFKDGRPYYVRGACGDGKRLQILKEIGGNSIRTYHSKNLQSILDSAEKYGMTVSAGLYLSKPDRVDYSDTIVTNKLLTEIRLRVEKYKDHPSLLIWCIGNEFQLDMDPDIDAWKFVNKVSKLIHKIDPGHPTSTAIAGYPRKHIPVINHYCSDLDVLFINKFGEIESIREKRSNWIWGYDGPYILSELGNSGYWDPEIPRSHNVVLEASADEKARQIKSLMLEAEKDGRILGYYAFYWGYKQEFTGSWYSIFGPRDEHTTTLDTLRSVWKNQLPKNKVPLIEVFDLVSSKDSFEVKPNEYHKIRYKIVNEPTDSLSMTAEIRTAPMMKQNIYEREVPPYKIRTKFRFEDQYIIFKSPKLEGPFRLHLTVKDNHGGIAFANLPFYVKK